MPINFTQLLRDSWNFMRNQPKFVFTFIILIVLVDFLFNFITPKIDLIQPTQASDELVLMKQILKSYISFPYLIYLILGQLANFFVACLCIVGIQRISQNASLNLSIPMTLQRFIGTLFLTAVSLSLFTIGMWQIIYAFANDMQPNILSSIFVITGIFIFFRLKLAHFSYLLGDQPLERAIATIWHKGRGRNGQLFLFTTLVNFLIPFLGEQLLSFSANAFTDYIMILINAALWVFALIFSYRFYSLFIQQS
ncbi:MAG: hypothetical protein Q4A81_03715 [Pasteurellaceae bacterium]|nr:hypothetical protein [Pasteurellaceae bacterium]